MKTSSSTQIQKVHPNTKDGFVIRNLKKLVLSQLSKLKYGKLTIRQGNDILKFGKVDNGINAEIIIKSPLFYYDIFLKGSIGAAESFIQKHWDTPDLDEVMRIFAINRDISTDIDSGFVNFIKPVRFLEYWRQRNTEEGSKKNIQAHYDLPDELFEMFLDESKMYSSAIFPSKETTLEEAQKIKLDTITKKLNIRKGDHILEIGTGWGALAIHLAENYDCHVTTTTISERQFAVAEQRIHENGLSEKITLLKQDYRKLSGKYDRVVSVEMIEAVGEKYLSTYISKISDLLKEDGLLVLQAITINDQEYARAVKEVDFIKKYIFPGSFIPSLHAITTSVKDNSNMRLYAQNDFAEDYAITLKHWKERFNHNASSLEEIGLGEEFQRLWNFYFSYCIGGFKERAIGVSHLTFGKPLYRS
ncbi:class I SAM-dependent methyltransferase [Halobacteriovorax marinus]|uniref:class I SAM-dependent methyltransferase n=1 Tax=Halobacteriovorax marinus TaxID=97084 RepID=UPI003A8DBDCA